MKRNRMILSGGFDPLHSGHIAMIREGVQKMDGGVIICLNSDAWLTRKKGKPFMVFSERKAIVESLRGVRAVVEMNDDDGTACDGIRQARELYPNDNLFFGNGGDRKFNSTPSAEQSLCHAIGIECVFGVGGDFKMNSSSVILSDWTKQTEQRPWGEFTSYETGSYTDGQYKVKTLKVNPGQRLSLQYHNQRNETWVVASGRAVVELDGVKKTLQVGESINIPVGAKHRISCDGSSPCVVLELQWGAMCDENDIVRIEDDYVRK